MLLVSAVQQPQTSLVNAVHNNPNHHHHHHHHYHHLSYSSYSTSWPHHNLCCRAQHSLLTTPFQKPSSPTTAPSTSSSSPVYLHNVTSTCSGNNGKNNSDAIKRSGQGIEGEAEGEDENLVASAAAVAAAIRKASKSPVEFVETVEKHGGPQGEASKRLVLPSSDFQRLCIEQLDLFRRIVHSDALLSVYVRPAGSYVMDRLELRRITFYPGVNSADIIILVGNFCVPAGLRAAEASISSQQAEFFPEFGAVVLPLVKHPFLVGFLVAELPKIAVKPEKENNELQQWPSPGATSPLPPTLDLKVMELQSMEDKSFKVPRFTNQQMLNAVNISRSLAMAYVMDQKAILLQQTSWQNNIRMSNLVEQIRGSLSSIRTLSRMLSAHTKRNEISFDIVEDIITQGDRISQTLQQLQDAMNLTKANIMRYNEKSLKKIEQQTSTELVRSHSSENYSMESSTKMQDFREGSSLTSMSKDLEMPMPPLTLAPIHHQGIRPCNISDMLADMVGAVRPLAQKQQQVVELSELSGPLEVAIEEPALRQALSNLIEGALLRTQVGGKVEIISTRAPAGGALVIIDDDGPDMHYMTQMHSLTPFGVELLSEEMVEDNMTWNFVACLTVAREILESYGCVVRVISPRKADAAIGAGGTRVELWLPSF